MAKDKNRKLYGEQSPTNLLDRSRELAEVRELYSKIGNLTSEIKLLKDKVFVVEQDAATVTNNINNYISNSSFLYSHRVYSMATFYNSWYMLSKWYGRPYGGTDEWITNGDLSESPHSVRASYGFPPIKDYEWMFPGYFPPMEMDENGRWPVLPDWRFSNVNALKLDVLSDNPLNELLKVDSNNEGFTPEVGKTIRLRGESWLVPIPSSILTLVNTRTYWITSVSQQEGQKYITLSASEPPETGAPTNIKVYGSGSVYAYPYVEKRKGVGWEVESGSLATSGGYTVATPLQEKKLRLADSMFFQCQLSFAPKVMNVSADSSGNKIAAEAHGLVEDTRLIFIAVGELPEGLETGVIYQVTEPEENSFKVKTLNGDAVVLGSDGSGTILARTVLRPDMTMKVSVWDNTNKRIFRSDRPVLGTALIGSHTPRDFDVTVKSDYPYYIGGNKFSLPENVQENLDAVPIGSKVTVTGPSLPSPLQAGVEYFWDYDPKNTPGYIFRNLDNSVVQFSDSAYGSNFQVVSKKVETKAEALKDRYYVLEVVMKDDRKFYSDPRAFAENQNLAVNTLNPEFPDAENAVSVSWQSVPSALGYNVYRSTDGLNFYLLGSAPSTSAQFVDYGGKTNKRLDLPDFTDDYSEYLTAEVRVAEATKDIHNTPGLGVRFTANLQFPSIISDYETSGEQFLQIEFLRPDGTPSTLSDIPMYNLYIDEVGLSYLVGTWTPSSRDLSIKPLPIVPRYPVIQGRGSRAEITPQNLGLEGGEINLATAYAFALFSGVDIGWLLLTGTFWQGPFQATNPSLVGLLNAALGRYSMGGGYSAVPAFQNIYTLFGPGGTPRQP